MFWRGLAGAETRPIPTRPIPRFCAPFSAARTRATGQTNGPPATAVAGRTLGMLALLPKTETTARDSYSSNPVGGKPPPQNSPPADSADSAGGILNVILGRAP